MRGDAARRARGHAPGMPTACPRHAAPHGHAAKARACSSQGQGRPPRTCSCQGLGMHAAAKAKARSQGRGMLAWARWHAPGCRQQGPWAHAAKALACTLPEGGMPRPWHAFGTPRRPWQHLGGLLLPCLHSLFGHLLLSPP